MIQFAVGLIAIIKGADWLTDGAASIAQRFGIPSIVIGLTIVAMGSSAPEFVVSVMSAIQGNTDMALGNIVGSNIFNILGIMGITAMVREIKVDRGNIRYDVPFAVLSSAVIAITALDSYLNEGMANSISRTDGMLLLCLFAIFMSYTIAIATPCNHVTNVTDVTDVTDVTSSASDKKQSLKDVVFIIGGLSCLIIGGDWLVSGASGIASALGISDAIIALTIVSAGTSAPELAASVMAARKGDTAMALGNVVGSVSFNVFFVLGAAATIHPLSLGDVTTMDIMTVLAASILLWVFCKFGKTYYTLTRSEGLILTLLAIAYYTYLVLQMKN
ncbi:MAG: calcium/sodium antiporter [Prevotella sp.]|nr:calcium/sodium antiporter [Candidatus Prevotella equi]